MSALEDRVRDTLIRHAGPAVGGSMPGVLRGGVRRRRAALAGSALALVAAGVVAVVLVSQTIPHADRSRGVAGTVSSPLGDTPAGWPEVLIDPSVAVLPNVGDAETISDGPVPLVAGTADGNAFTLYAYTRSDGDAPVACVGFVGFAPPGTALSATDPVETCSDTALVPQAVDLEMLGAGGSRDVPIEASFGLVSERVRAIGVWGGGGDTGEFPVTILDGLDGWNVSPFLFIPSSDAGPVTVYADGRQPLATASPCPPGDVPRGCSAEVVQLAPAGTGAPPTSGPDGWPAVTTGGDFEPYVDHVQSADGTLDAGVVGEKHVVEYGTVNGIPWSLTGFAAAGGDWSGSGGPDGTPGPAGELFLGARGSIGGGGISLYSTDPWSPNDLGASGFGFGGPKLTGYAGVVSPRVASVEVRPEEGHAVGVTLVDGPSGVDARYFVVWTPNDLSGELVALDGSGEVIDSLPMCASVPDQGSNSACS